MQILPNETQVQTTGKKNKTNQVGNDYYKSKYYYNNLEDLKEKEKRTYYTIFIVAQLILLIIILIFLIINNMHIQNNGDEIRDIFNKLNYN